MSLGTFGRGIILLSHKIVVFGGIWTDFVPLAKNIVHFFFEF